jgi:hypothetical protein
MYSLRRTRDGAGDSGTMSLLIRYNENKELEHKHNSRPEVGWAMQVGSIYARSYSAQDFWQTTYITEILEDTEEYVRFKTGNSEYEWKII